MIPRENQGILFVLLPCSAASQRVCQPPGQSKCSVTDFARVFRLPFRTHTYLHMTCNHRTAPGSTLPPSARRILPWSCWPGPGSPMPSRWPPSGVLLGCCRSRSLPWEGPNFFSHTAQHKACAVTTVSTVLSVSTGLEGANLPRQSSPPPSIPNYVPAYLPTLHYTALHCTTCTCLLHRVSPSTFLPHIASTSVISGPNFRPTAHITISPYSPAYRFLNHLVRPPSLPIPALATIPVCLDRCNQPATCCFFLLFHPSSSRGSSPPGLNPRLGGCQCLLPARLASSPCPPCPALQPIASIRTKKAS